MVYGDNKGHRYEKRIADILKNNNVKLLKEPAGSSGDTDLEFLHKNKKFSIEVKENAVGPDWGQVGLKYKNNLWEWSSSKKRKNIIQVYDKIKIEGVTGILKFLNNKFIPNKGSVDIITKKQHDEDFEFDQYFSSAVESIGKY